MLVLEHYRTIPLINTHWLGTRETAWLILVIVAASLAGTTAAILTFDPRDPCRAILLAVLLIILGAFMDANTTNLIRPNGFLVSQALIGFASLLFLSRAMVIGITRCCWPGRSTSSASWCCSA